MLVFMRFNNFPFDLGRELEVIVLVALFTEAFWIVDTVRVLAFGGEFSYVDISVTNGTHTSCVVIFISMRAICNFGQLLNTIKFHFLPTVMAFTLSA